MKKNLNIAFCGVLLVLGYIACSGKANEEKVKIFATNFAQKAVANQIESLKGVYPDIENADSVALKYVEDGIIVKPASAEFAAAIPNVDKINYSWENFDNAANYLRSLGYPGSLKENDWDGYDGGYSGIFKLIRGPRECIVIYCC